MAERCAPEVSGADDHLEAWLDWLLSVRHIWLHCVRVPVRDDSDNKVVDWHLPLRDWLHATLRPLNCHAHDFLHDCGGALRWRRRGFGQTIRDASPLAVRDLLHSIAASVLSVSHDDAGEKRGYSDGCGTSLNSIGNESTMVGMLPRIRGMSSLVALESPAASHHCVMIA